MVYIVENYDYWVLEMDDSPLKGDGMLYICLFSVYI